MSDVATTGRVWTVEPITIDSKAYWTKSPDGTKSEHGNKTRAGKRALHEAIMALKPGTGRYLKIEVCEITE
jgi:hypothetical protein